MMFDYEPPTANVTVDGEVCELTLWETAEDVGLRQRELNCLLYKKTDVVLVCFSIDR